jgi:hypothetical protein
MSHIPNSAMPHAAPQAANDATREAGEPGSRFEQLADMVKEHPKTAAAAGAAVAVGLAAAAAIPALRARGRSGKDGNSKSSG